MKVNIMALKQITKTDQIAGAHRHKKPIKKYSAPIAISDE